MVNLRLAALGLVAFAASGAQAAIQTVSVTAGDRGFYTEGGISSPSNRFYTTGRVQSSAEGAPGRVLEERSFFLFDIPAAMSGTIVGATLTLRIGSGASDTGSETFTLFDVTTDLAALAAGTAGAAAFADLGGGVSYGSVDVAPAGFSFDLVGIDLNAAALAAILPGQAFALGGAITSLSGAGQEFLFGGTGALGLARLDLLVDDAVAVSAPAALPLMLTALAGFSLVRRRRG